jgi:general secretion pathway protein D
MVNNNSETNKRPKEALMTKLFLLLTSTLLILMLTPTVSALEKDDNKDKKDSETQVEQPKGAKAVEEGKELVNIDFPEPTEITDIIRAVALWTGKNIILGRGVSGKVQIISPEKVTKEEAYQSFLSALSSLGYTTVQTGKVIKIMKAKAAMKESLKTYLGSKWAPQTDAMITQIVPLKYINARQIQNTLIRIVSASSLIAYEPTNTLIITDSGYQVQRILDIIEQLDVQKQQPKVVMIPIKYSDPNSIAKKLKEILGSGGATRAGGNYQSFKILTDDRTNSLIVFGPPRSIKDVVSLAKKFDIRVDDPSLKAQIHVRPLDYADAKKLAQTLSSLAKSQKSSSSFRRTTKSGTTSSVADLGEGVKISADEATNSLLITGNKSAYDTLNLLIKKLDVRRSQVFIQTDIIEISEGDDFDSQISIFAGVKGGGTNSIIGWQGGGVASLIAASIKTNAKKDLGTEEIKGVADSFKENLTIGVLSGKPVNIPGLGDISPGGLISIIKRDNNSKVLSTPQILTSNNQEASISVGETVLYTTQSLNSTTGAIATKVEKQDASTILTIKPNISYSGYVTLDVKLESNYIKSYGAGNIPQVAKRNTKQLVTVKNKQTVVMSGLLDSKESKTFKKIPLLGDIPLIGWLFRNSSLIQSRSNLIIFITPHIVHGAADLASIYKIKIKERDEFINQLYGSDYKKGDFYKLIPQLKDGEYTPTQIDKLEEQNRNDDLNNSLEEMKNKEQKSNSALKKQIEQSIPMQIQPSQTNPPARDKGDNIKNDG